MKPEIHPEYVETTVNCGCGESFKTRSTVTTGTIYVEVCDKCHPFYTGKQRILDTGGRVAKFEERFGKKSNSSNKQLFKRPHLPTFSWGAVFLFWLIFINIKEKDV